MWRDYGDIHSQNPNLAKIFILLLERFLLEFSVYLQIEYTSYFLSTLYTGNQS